MKNIAHTVHRDGVLGTLILVKENVRILMNYVKEPIKVMI